MLKFLPIKHCIDCDEERPFEHKVCTECGAILAHSSKPNPDYTVEYSVKHICSQCGRENTKDHIGKFCPIEGGSFTIKEVKEEIILKGGFNSDFEYPFGHSSDQD